MLPKTDNRLKIPFPKIEEEGYEITSPETRNYNCLAWAVFDDQKRWDPNLPYYWPASSPREVTISAFIKAYESVGFSICESGELESEFEKIVIFVKDNGEPTHAARMLNQDTWTSKLGHSYDISHKMNSLNGDSYGKPKVFMKRVVQK